MIQIEDNNGKKIYISGNIFLVSDIDKLPYEDNVCMVHFEAGKQNMCLSVNLSAEEVMQQIKAQEEIGEKQKSKKD